MDSVVPLSSAEASRRAAPADSVSHLVEIAMAALIGAMLLFLSWRAERDYDIFWHLRNGDVIAEAGAIPSHDVFSFTVPGAKFEAPDWLSDVFLAHLYRVGGWSALQTWKLLCLASAAVMLRRAAVVKGADPWLAWGCLAVGILGAEFRFLLRPLMFQFVFVAATLLNLESWRIDRRWWRLAILPVLGVLWVNLHSSYVLGFLVPCCYLAADLYEWAAHRRDPVVARPRLPDRTTAGLGGAIVLTGFAFGLNPGGFAQLAYLGRWTGQVVMGQVISENLPANLASITSGGVGVCVAVMVISFIVALRRVALVDVAILVLFATFGLKYRRFLALWCLMLAPTVARNLTCALAGSCRATGRRVLASTLLLGAGLFTFFGSLSSPTSLLMAEPTSDRHPIAAVDWLSTHQVAGNVFNTFSFGGYILWRGYPGLKVFIDGRGLVYDAFLARYDEVVSSSRALLEADDQFGFDAVVFARDAESVLDTLAMSGRFDLVYWDDLSTVWLSRKSEFADLRKRYAYPSEFKPWRFDEMLGTSAPEALAVAATRSMRESPNAVMAWVFAAELMARHADLHEGLRVARRGLEFHPDAPTLLSTNGSLLSRAGDAAGARDVFARVVALDPSISQAWLQLGQQEYRLGNLDGADAAWSRVLKLAPDDLQAQGKLAQLRKQRQR